MRWRKMTLLIGVSLAVWLAVLLTPELLSTRCEARINTTRTGWLDLRVLRWSAFRTEHQNGARRQPSNAFGDRTHEKARHAAAPVRSHHDQICLEVGGELSNLVSRGMGPQMRNHPHWSSRRPAARLFEIGNTDTDVGLELPSPAGIVHARIRSRRFFAGTRRGSIVDRDSMTFRKHVHHVHHMQFGVRRRLRKSESMSQGQLTCRRIVDTNQDEIGLI